MAPAEATRSCAWSARFSARGPASYFFLSRLMRSRSVSTSISTKYRNARISRPIIMAFSEVVGCMAWGNRPRRMAA